MITVYTQPGCAPCRRLIEYLTGMGVEFLVEDITESDAAYDYVKQLGATTTPVVVNTSWVAGFDETTRQVIDKWVLDYAWNGEWID